MKEFDLKEITSVLPATPGILNKDKLFNSAVLIPFIKINSEYHLLFEKRAAHIRQGSEICFPGGEYEEDKDNTFADAAIRETSEELGLAADKILIIGQLDTLVGTMGATIDSFIGELNISSLAELNIDKTEVEKVFTIPLSFFTDKEPDIYHLRLEVQPSITENDGTIKEIFPAKALNLPERYWLPWAMPVREVYVYKTEEGTIWGLTAELIREVTAKLKQLL